MGESAGVDSRRFERACWCRHASGIPSLRNSAALVVVQRDRICRRGSLDIAAVLGGRHYGSAAKVLAGTWDTALAIEMTVERGWHLIPTGLRSPNNRMQRAADAGR